MHFAIGAAAALAISLLFSRLSGESNGAAPAMAVIVGTACASLAHFVSPWATPVTLLLMALSAMRELREFRTPRPPPPEHE
jgi:hypothetical protein